MRQKRVTEERRRKHSAQNENFNLFFEENFEEKMALGGRQVVPHCLRHCRVAAAQ